MITILRIWWRATRNPFKYRWITMETKDGSIFWGAATEEFSHLMERNEREELRERLAALQHEQWSGWMVYLFSKCLQSGEGTGEDVVIPASYAHNLVRLMQASYGNLTEEEKESDRTEADKYLPIIRSEREKALRAFAEKVKEEFYLNDTNRKSGVIITDNDVMELAIDLALDEAMKGNKIPVEYDLLPGHYYLVDESKVNAEFANRIAEEVGCTFFFGPKESVVADWTAQITERETKAYWSGVLDLARKVKKLTVADGGLGNLTDQAVSELVGEWK